MPAATKTSGDNVHKMAQAIAKEIVEQREAGVEAVELGAISGSFTLEIKYNDTTYSLVVTIPDSPGGEYVFSLTETGADHTPHDIASFKYKDSSNWAVAAGLPAPITFGGVTIETLALKLGVGSVTA